MSRSRKKIGIIKDGGKIGKQIHNRRFRSTNNQRIRQGLEPLHKYQITNQWDICDWKMFWNDWSPWLIKMEYTKEEIAKRKREYFNK